jgi:hypothetical protein
MHDVDKETVLLICSDAAEASQIMTQLYDAQIRVVGPIHTARMALALSAQTEATLALVVGEPTGERKTPQLAQALLETWGVRSMLLDETAHDALPDVSWRAPQSQVARIRRALTRVSVPA